MDPGEEESPKRLELKKSITGWEGFLGDNTGDDPGMEEKLWSGQNENNPVRNSLVRNSSGRLDVSYPQKWR